MVLAWKRTGIEPDRIQHLRGRKTVLQRKMKEQAKRQKKNECISVRFDCLPSSFLAEP